MCKFKFRLIAALLTFGIGVLGVSFWIIKKTNHITTISDELKLVSTETADQSEEIKSASRRPIIEIWKELQGSVAIRGTSLYFRLYDDGMVEFDYEVRKITFTDGTVEFEHEYRKEKRNPPPYTKSVETSLERIPLTKISEEEFRRIKSMLEDLTKSKNIKKEYGGVALTLDVITKLTILLKENDAVERKIIINDSDYDVMNSKFEKIFPKSLVHLTKEVHLLRSVYKNKRRMRKDLSPEID